jgi:phosphoserine phosphatase
MQASHFIAMVTSDWNECLAPCGPFDAIAHHHPQKRPVLDDIFRDYTGNRITLAAAIERIIALLPGGLPAQQMDSYLADTFTTYEGIGELIAWCAEHDILFMINTTGMIGYFQRALALGLLPAPAVLAAHPWIRYADAPSDPGLIFPLLDTGDKARHSAAAAARFKIPPERVIVIGDSGGDGPHFAWAAQSGAKRIASMAKASLLDYCRQRAIRIDRHFGCTYAQGQPRDPEMEKKYDFRELVPVIGELLQLRR